MTAHFWPAAALLPLSALLRSHQHQLLHALLLLLLLKRTAMMTAPTSLK
jgi:hypothetical protein